MIKPKCSGGKLIVNKVSKIMVYVEDQDEIVKFWNEKVGFSIISEQHC